MDFGAMMENIPGHLKESTTFQTAGSKTHGKISIGFGLAERVGDEASQLAQGHVLLITDKTIVDIGLIQVILNSLSQAGFQVDMFDQVEPEPHIETARKVQEMVRKKAYALIIGLGGGSPMDIAKAASITATNKEDILNYMQGAPINKAGVPTILMPTTSGTGSEVSPFIVLGLEDKKIFISSPHAYATVALIDPMLTATMPPKVTAATGLDALTHGVEGLIGKPNPMSEALTMKCVEYVFRFLERAYTDGNDLEARYFMAFASVMGMMAYTQGGGLYAHSCSYILTLHKGYPHGFGCGLALPYTLIFNIDHINDILLHFSKAIDSNMEGSDEEIILKTIERFYDLLPKVGFPKSLTDIGLDRELLPIFSEELINTYYRARNPRSMDLDESHRFMELMWDGRLARI